MKRLFLLSVLAAFALALISCGGGNNTTPPPTPGSMAGAWDFTATSPSLASQGVIVAVDAVLAQDSSGNISATGSATANGPTGNVSVVVLGGSSLSNISNVLIDFLGQAGCNDNGTRKITGTINSSNQVNLTFDNGGEMITITGTLSASATPPFSGTSKISDPGCGDDGMTGTVTGVLAASLAGTYSGAVVGNSSENISLTLTAGANNSLTGNGTDSANGSFTVSGSSVGNAFTVTSTPSGGSGSTTLFGYYDPQVGGKGTAFSSVLVPGATSCANGAQLAGESCLFGTFAKQ